MGKVKKDKFVPLFTPLQRRIFHHLAKDKMFVSQFYFTGGTALSAFYLRHRESEDLDFFSENDFDDRELEILMDELSKTLSFRYQFTKRYKARIFEFVDDEKLLIKLDFVHHPHKRIERGIFYEGVAIDSLRDIATNKLLTINQRMEVKDFVDLHFLLKEFTLWDLMYGVEAKYRMKLDRILIALDFMKVEQFDVLPKMLVPLTVKELHAFFKKQAVELGKRIVE